MPRPEGWGEAPPGAFRPREAPPRLGEAPPEEPADRRAPLEALPLEDRRAIAEAPFARRVHLAPLEATGGGDRGPHLLLVGGVVRRHDEDAARLEHPPRLAHEERLDEAVVGVAVLRPGVG